MLNDGDIVPLIRVVGSSYVVEESTLEWLTKRDSPFVVMTCAGKFRTGKSFLLNRFVDCEQGKGFGVGDTVQACTRGLWVCRKFVHNDETNRDVLVIDTEGIDALDVESSHDMRIFALAVLLGSVFCFNSMSHIDEAAVQTLSLMTRVASSMATASHKPSLYWILRDFALQMVDESGSPMTHQQYLDSALATPHATPHASKCNTRDAIKNIFGTRHLVTLPRPHKTEATRLERIDRKGGSGGVNVKFERYLSTFRDHVSANAPFISAGGVPMSGSVYADYVRAVVSLVNESDSVPPLDDAWTMLTRSQHSDVIWKLRKSLTETTKESCPTASEREVVEWITRVTTWHVDEARFMEPSPDKSEMSSNLIRELTELARAMHRIQDTDKLAQAKVDAIVHKMDSDAVASWDMVAFLAEELGLEAFASKALDAIVKRLWPKVAERLDEDASTIALSSERVKRAEQELEELRERESALKSEMESLTQRHREDASTCTDDLVNPSSPRNDGNLEETQRLYHEALSEKETLLTRADAADAKLVDAQAEVSRLTDQCRSFTDGIEILRKDAEAEIRRSKDEADACKREASHATSQRDVLVTEVDKLHRLVRDAQEKSVELHRTSLDETRNRDTDARVHNESVRKAHSEMLARAEIAEREVKTLKRRVEELLVVDGEAKRLRTSVHEHEVAKARLETEGETSKRSLETIRAERDTLRDAGQELSNQVAVLKASQMLESCRRSIRDA